MVLDQEVVFGGNERGDVDMRSAEAEAVLAVPVCESKGEPAISAAPADPIEEAKRQAARRMIAEMESQTM